MEKDNSEGKKENSENRVKSRGEVTPRQQNWVLTKLCLAGFQKSYEPETAVPLFSPFLNRCVDSHYPKPGPAL